MNLARIVSAFCFLQLAAVGASAQKIVPADYTWRAPFDKAGGNCTGFYIHPQAAEVRYVQSGDTGGVLWDPKEERWLNFTDHTANVDFGYLVGLALDPKNPDIVYYAAGHPKGEIFKSTDRAKSFTAAKLAKPDGKPVYINGGEDASTSGDYLVVDPNNADVLFFASRLDGLWRSDKASAPDSWKKVESFTARGDVAKTWKADGKMARELRDRGGLSLVAIDAGGGTIELEGQKVSRVIYVGVVGDRRVQSEKGGPVSTEKEGGIWRSGDGGQTWKLLGAPVEADASPSRAYVASDGALWATISGRVCKVARDGEAFTDLAAPKGKTGYFAVAVDPFDPRHALASCYGVAAREASYGDKNQIARTTDGGATWTVLKATYSSPPWWQWFASPTHWVRFDPHGAEDAQGRCKVAWLGDWIGPWKCGDITAETTHWDLIGKGREGSYFTALTCPPAMEPGRPRPEDQKHGTRASLLPIAPLVAQGADFDGFRYLHFTAVPRKRLTQSAAGVNDGLADGTGAAFCESDPRFIAAVGGWDHGLNGGGGASTDGGLTWTGFEGKGLRHPGFKDHPKLGRVAVGANTQANGFPIIVWVPRFAVPRYSLDWGRTWAEGTGAPKGTSPSEWDSWQTLAADPVEGRTFYLFSNNLDKTGFAQIYKTTDGGATWSLAGKIKASWKDRTFTVHQLEAMPGRSGDLWLSVHDPFTNAAQEPASGFYRSTDAGATWTKLPGIGPVHGLAFGAPAPGRANPTLVVAGTIGKESGIFLSDDATATAIGNFSDTTWKKIWDHQTSDMKPVIHCFKSIGADRQSYGRVYAGAVGTGRGVYYGEPVATAAPTPPVNVSTLPGFADIVVEWTDPIGAESYEVERTQAGKAVKFQTKEARIIDREAAAGTPASYRVVARNKFGASAPSAAMAALRYAKIEPVARFGSPHNNKDSAEHATDGNPRTAFDARAGDGAYAGFDAGRETVVTLIRYWPRDWNGKRMIGGEFQGAASQDGPWTTLHTVAREPANGAWTEARLSDQTKAFRFFRYVGGKGSHGNIAEMEFFEGGAVPASPRTNP